MSRILVVSPHPDDESIGCGGTLHGHVVDGDSVEVLFLTSGEKGAHDIPASEIKFIREQEAKDAAEILGISEIEFWREPDGRLRANQSNVKRLVEKLETLRPNRVYVPHDDEMHPDHRAACRLVRRAVSKQESAGPAFAVLMYEVWTPLQHIDHIVDISPFVGVKRRAIRAYKSQCSVMRFDDAALGLNRYRGEMHSWPGGDYAEIFRDLPL